MRHEMLSSSQLFHSILYKLIFTGNRGDTDNQPINYFNWYNEAERDSSTASCIYIDVDRGNKWQTQSCTTYMNYFICKNGKLEFTNNNELYPLYNIYL